MKTKANSRVLQVTSGLLASVLLLSALPCTAFAASGVEKSAVPNEPETADNAIALDAAVPEEALTSVELSEYTVPSGMTLEELSDQGYTERVYGAETNLYSAVLSDGKGNYTLYYYDSPIKYVDEDGVVRDKILQPMALPDGGYRTRQSDILTTFSPNLTDGIKLEREDQSIRLTPLEAEAQAALTVDSARVAYAVDVATRYEYTLTPMGFKEDIIVESYTGQTEYSFLLETNGLTLVEEYGTYHLVDEYNTVQAYLGDIILFTADERNNTFGSMTAQTVEEGQSYLLTIELDEDWLSDPNTLYPITIDPTVSYNSTGDIEDVTLDSTKTYAGDSGSIYVGRNSDGAKRRALMRFPKLNIIGYNVTSASVSIRDLMCEGTTLRVECREYTGNSWSESGTTTWSSVGSSAGGSLLSYQNISYDIGNAFTEKHRYTFDITTLAEKWAAGTVSPAKGIVFRTTDNHESGSSTDGRTFASINRGSNPPRLMVTYNYLAIRSSTDHAIVGSTIQLTANTSASQSEITWSSSDNNIASVSSTGLVTLHKLGTATIKARIPNGMIDTFEVYGILKDGIYTLKNVGSNYNMAINSTYVFTNEYPNLYKPSSSTTSQYWRIKYEEKTIYTIQPYLNSYQELAYSSSKGIYFLEAPIHIAATPVFWDITEDGLYRTIRHHKSGLALTSPANPLNYDQLAMSNYDTSSSAISQRWIMTEVTSPPSGIVWKTDDSDACKTSTSTNMTLHFGDHRTFTLMYYSAEYTDQAFGDWEPIKGNIVKTSEETVTAIGFGEQTLRKTHTSGLKFTVNITVEFSAILYSVPSNGHEHYNVLRDFNNNLKQKAEWYTPILRTDNDPLINYCKNDLLSANLFVARCHGNAVDFGQGVVSTGIVFNENSCLGFYSDPYTGMATKSQYIHDEEDYSNLLIAVFIACSVGAENDGFATDNLPSKLVKQGATAAVGFEKNISCDLANEWACVFLEKLINGYPLKDAVSDACSSVEKIDGKLGIQYCNIYGDEYVQLP